MNEKFHRELFLQSPVESFAFCILSHRAQGSEQFFYCSPDMTSFAFVSFTTHSTAFSGLSNSRVS